MTTKARIMKEANLAESPSVEGPWPPTIVWWVDAMSAWGDLKVTDSEARDPLPLRKSIGFLEYIGEDEIRIVGTDDRKNTLGNHASDMLRIPIDMVKQIRVLKEEQCHSRHRSKKVPVRKRSANVPKR